MADKYFSLVLHSHIPYVLAHGSWPHGMDWLYEAAAESYMPLLDVFERLAGEGIPARTNVSFTPVLMEQLKDPGFVSGFDEYLKMKIEAAVRDRAHFGQTGNAALRPLTDFWEAWYRRLLEDFHGRYRPRHHRRLPVSPGPRPDRGPDVGRDSRLFPASLPRREHPPAGPPGMPHVSDSISAATPAASGSPSALTGRDTPGRTLSGTASRTTGSGVDEILGQEGLGLFLRRFAPPQGRRGQGRLHRSFPGPEAPLGKVPGGLQAGRRAAERRPIRPIWPIPRTSRSSPGTRSPARRSGAARWATPATGDTSNSTRSTSPAACATGGSRRATRTWASRSRTIRPPSRPGSRNTPDTSRRSSNRRSPAAPRASVAALYDTELFGHWWFEGPEWLYHVIRKLSTGPVRPATAGDVLERLPPRTIDLSARGLVGQGRLPLDLAQRRHLLDLEEDLPHRGGRRGARAAPGASRPAAPQAVLPGEVPPRKLRLALSHLDLVGPRLCRAPGRRALRAGPDPGRLAQGRPGPRAPPKRRSSASFESEDHLFEEVVLPDGTVI